MDITNYSPELVEVLVRYWSLYPSRYFYVPPDPLEHFTAYVFHFPFCETDIQQAAMLGVDPLEWKEDKFRSALATAPRIEAGILWNLTLRSLPLIGRVLAALHYTLFLRKLKDK